MVAQLQVHELNIITLTVDMGIRKRTTIVINSHMSNAISACTEAYIASIDYNEI